MTEAPVPTVVSAKIPREKFLLTVYSSCVIMGLAEREIGFPTFQKAKTHRRLPVGFHSG
jgi:hypothetical protein